MLGKNGYITGFRGNLAAFTLVVAAAVSLIVVRGALGRAVSTQRGTATSAVILSKLLYVVGVVALIYGEPSVVTGKAAAFTIGPAADYAVVIAVVALLVLVSGRVAAPARARGLLDDQRNSARASARSSSLPESSVPTND